MKRTLTTGFILFSLFGAGALFYKGERISPYSVDENTLYRISDEGCVYTIYSEKDQAEFFISGETATNVAAYVGKPIHIQGKFIYTQHTQNGKKRLLHPETSLGNADCTSSEDIGALAVIISKIAEAP